MLAVYVRRFAVITLPNGFKGLNGRNVLPLRSDAAGFMNKRFGRGIV